MIVSPSGLFGFSISTGRYVVPSPIAHTAAGYLVYRVLSTHIKGLPPGLVWVGVALSLLPDVDAAIGIWFGDMGRFHNHMMSSPFIAVLMSLVIGGAGWQLRGEFYPWFILALVCYLMHIVMDFFTTGRGIMLLWPLSEERYKPPFTVFHGVHWSDGLFSSSHIWTAVSEVATIAVIVLIYIVFRYVRNNYPAGTSGN